MKEHSSAYKRNKNYRLDDFFVAPKTLALGTRFETKQDSDNNAIQCLIQNQYPYVSIIETLQTQFKNEHFLKTFLKYNEKSGNGHECTDGTYTDFCCGSLYKSISIFREMNIQIQLFCDEFEVCNPLGSRATMHKVHAVYFIIRNMPNHSKLSNIFLVTVFNSDDIKCKETDFNNILAPIVDEMKVLESVGIEISSKMLESVGLKDIGSLVLKGTVVAWISDNLGANSSLGFVESFNSTYYCRICEMPKKNCQTECKENSKEIRTVEKYQKHIETIKNSVQVDFAETKGIKRYCILNDLKYFNIMINFATDTMHDISEGAIPFVLKNLFEHCINKKIFTKETLVNKAQFYNYGMKKNVVPSMIVLNKGCLNQTASQSMSLFLHIPFILFEYKDKIGKMWECITTLQKIVQILFSPNITKEDIQDLRKYVSQHLSFIQKHFNVKLLPKHHLMLHYAMIIELMGPLILLNVIRFEAKHQMFKQFVKKSQNFKDINHSIAIKHQKWMCQRTKSYKSEIDIKFGKKYSTIEVPTEVSDSQTSPIWQVKWLKKDNYTYKSGSVVLYENNLQEVKRLFVSDSECFLYCSTYKFVEKCHFSNSFKIKKNIPEKMIAIKLSSLRNYKLYKKVYLSGECYVIAEDLDVQKAFELLN